MEILKGHYKSYFICNEKYLFFIVVSGLYQEQILDDVLISSLFKHRRPTPRIAEVSMYCKNHNGSGSYFVSKGKFSLKKELIISVSDSKLPPGCIVMRSKRHARSELKAHLTFVNMHSDKLDKSVDTLIHCCTQYQTCYSIHKICH